MKKQTRILRELLRAKERCSVDKLMEYSEFSRREVYHALEDLKHRGLIEKEREYDGTGYKKPPYGKIYVKIRRNSEKRSREIIDKEISELKEKKEERKND